MALKDYLFTSESVSEGHPDKVCDQISDAILDAILAREIELGDNGGGSVDNARVACETFITTGLVVVGGEVRTRAYMRSIEGIEGVVSVERVYAAERVPT